MGYLITIMYKMNWFLIKCKKTKEIEQNIKKQIEIKTNEGLYDNQKDNTLSLIVKKISQICIQIIQTIVLLISQFISNIL